MSRHYRFEETCSGCPHQFDVWDGNKKVAYVRYRWGYLSVNPYVSNNDIDFNTTIFDKQIGDGLDGVLPYNEEDKILDKLDREIYKYYSTNNNQEKKWYDE